ncbi:DUF952 domain-containing protein [uncultured Brevundimonas sp.]|uniref:DUF952 domain-containing protein n=1 Tax=uncultured Brevundimonas sp. TaxID=213418 RepID=UPI00261BEAB7|nr:DUF952 domain-containing protein [uncultured Brevundimonas sp.]
MSGPVYKLVGRTEWAAARAAGAYAGSEVDRADGYIHLSTAAQLAETARRHFAGRADLVLVAVDPAALGGALRWEPSRGGDLFPHLYQPLPLSAAGPERALAVRADGVMVFEDGTAGWT